MVIHSRRRFSRLSLAIAASPVASPLIVVAQSSVQLRIGSLVPRNSPYHVELMKVGEAWRAAQGSGARFSVFTDGAQGGEAEMVRRMRIGQLQGALMSVVGLREIDPSISALQNLPLLFKSWDEIDYVRERIRATIERRFSERGFVILGWGDAGWVRFFSRERAVHPDDFRRMKFFAWGSEPEQQAIMKSLGYAPIPLETGDALAAIQTGMISVVPSTPYFALASQIFSAAPHMLDINWAPMVGALVVTQKVWDAMLPIAREALRSHGETAGVAMRVRARAEVDEAVEAMKKRGLMVSQPDAAQRRAWDDLAESVYPKIRGTLVPAEAFDEVFEHLRAFRAQRRS
jgi:TRAP-type C4-dicarboxylate transport system substrate-binding protein